MRFLTLTQLDGSPVDLNFEHVAAFQPSDASKPDSVTKITFSVPGVLQLLVREAYGDVRRKLAPANPLKSV